jgi:hypothetical protein
VTAALVLKLGRYRLHRGGLAVVRSLGRFGVPVLQSRWREPGSPSRTPSGPVAFGRGGRRPASVPGA